MSATQPDRVFLNSSDDNNLPQRSTWNEFTLSLPSGVINATSCMPLRATIPNVSGTSIIPDYECVFWYETSTDNIIWLLKCVRLYPSYFYPTGGYTTYSKNRYFNSPNDLVIALNIASSTGGDLLANNPYWIADDLTFSFNSVNNKISVVGNISQYYRITGWNSPKIQIAINTNTIIYPNLGSKTNEIQPLIPLYNLNLRLGYTMSGFSSAPGITNLTSTASTQCANITNLPFSTSTSIEANTYPNMVYTQNIFIYVDILENSTLSSNNQRNLLMAIPVNASPLGVIQYSSPPLFNYIYHLNKGITSIKFILLDDANQPFTLSDNANVNIEIGFRYN